MVVELIVFGDSIGFEFVVAFGRIPSPANERIPQIFAVRLVSDTYLKSATSLSTVSRSPEP